MEVLGYIVKGTAVTICAVMLVIAVKAFWEAL